MVDDRSSSERSEIRLLGVLLCYNDADILPDVLEHLIENNHKLVVWDHSSDDETEAVLDKYGKHLVERRRIPRSVDFYDIYPAMSRNIMRNYRSSFDWVSWPDQDEILEGPDRKKSYYEHIVEVFNSGYDWIEFNNFNYWFTEEDDTSVVSPTQRLRRYCLFPDCAPRIRSWRAKITNIRVFNHNALDGKKYPARFNLRHYPMRSQDQAKRRLYKDRIGIRRGTANYHYDNIRTDMHRISIPPNMLHFDDGKSELDATVIFNWRGVYGHEHGYESRGL